MTELENAPRLLREKFHDLNNALQGMSNLIVALKRDKTYTSEIGDLLSDTFSRVKEVVEETRNLAVEGGVATPDTGRIPSKAIRFPVLLIDADPLSRRMSLARLKALGYESLAVDGETAALKELAEDKGIRAALVDAVDAKSTERLCKSLLEAAPDLGVILSYHEPSALPDEKSLGFTPVGMLRKPLKAHRVAELMGIIGRQGSPDATRTKEGVEV